MGDKKKLQRGTIVIVSVLALLVLLVVGLAVLHYDTVMERRVMQESGTLLFTAENYTHILFLEDLKSIGPVDISPRHRGEPRSFTGVPLAGIFDYLDVDYSQTTSLIFTSLDGFATGISIAEALDTRNTFIVFEEDGEPLGTREEGGLGPYMLVVARDRFPNRWARYLMEITLQ